MNFSFYIAKRYLFTKNKNNAINIITFIAGIGAFAGALALFIVLSGFAGLKEFSVQFTNEVDPDLKVLPKSGKTINFNSTIASKLEENKNIFEFSKVLEERVLLTYENRSTPAFIKGVDLNFNQVTATDKWLIMGRWFEWDEAQRVVIGGEISRKLSLGISGRNDVLQLLIPKPGKGIVSDPTKAFNQFSSLVVGVYDINEDWNDKYVFSSYKTAQDLLGLAADEISALEVKLVDSSKEKQVKREVEEAFAHEEVVVKNRIELNDELYKMLNTENLAVYLIFTLVLIIALFNVGGAIVMAILDKRDNIKTLYNMGAHPRKIRRIFLLQGSLLTFVGGALGLLIGIIAVVAQQFFGWIMITQDLPYPVKLQVDNIFLVLITILLLGLIASYIGSTRVSKVLLVS